MRLAGARGQATTEYLMIAGLILAMAVLLLGMTEVPFRGLMQQVLECVLDDCDHEGWG
jgi:hypothetical protein